MMIEILFPFINQFIFIRRMYPLIDYFNPFLNSISENKGREERLEALMYSDTSTMVQQVLIQHNRFYCEGPGHLDPHEYRCLAIYTYLKKSLKNSEEKKEIYKNLAKMKRQSVFNCYKKLALIVEGVASKPDNLLLHKKMQEAISETIDFIVYKAELQGIRNDRVEMVLKHSLGMVDDDYIRHWIITLNDFIRSDKDVLKSALDDEMVCLDLSKFFKTHLNWFERRAKQTVLEISEENSQDLYNFLNIDVLKNQDFLDQNYITFANPIKIVVMGGTGTFHEFIQPLIQTIKKFTKFRLASCLRIYIVPTTNFSLADILSQKDHWYQRNIDVPFRVTPVVPLMKGSKPGKVRRNIDEVIKMKPRRGRINEVHKFENIVFELLEKKIQTYLTEATKFVKLYLYKIDAIGKKKQKLKKLSF